ncbi:MAG: hypothetical protein EXX96DRAFT_523951 [Benjaminiella poitrasii]|nr:MAG: hypothetical protein EXX96DRAFT_523951 [Benjaminiella poitrasii]
MGCCYSRDKPKWKREVVPDHKFDNINLDMFYDASISSRLMYMSVFLLSLKSFAVYVADLWTAVSLLVIGQTTVTPAIPTEISKWIFFACIMISFLVLIWDMFKAYRILKSRDIAFAFTSVIANRYLSMKDYRYYCLFRSINANSKGIDNYAFFIFFQLKGWKRLLLAEAPRQVINVVTLEALVPEWLKIHNGSVEFDNEVLGETILQQILTATMAFSILVFAISFILVCVALVLYVPLMCHMRGNLKEYCCHKVDKRITEILRRQNMSYDRTKFGGSLMSDQESRFMPEDQYYKRPLLLNQDNYYPSSSSSSAAGYDDYSYASQQSSPYIMHSHPQQKRNPVTNNTPMSGTYQPSPYQNQPYPYYSSPTHNPAPLPYQKYTHGY